MNKTAHYMISKYSGKCSNCGERVEAGEAIYWLARGQIECNDCTGGAAYDAVMNNSAPAAPKVTADNTHADKWAAAMDWDTSAPQKPAQPRKAKAVPKSKPAKIRPVVAATVPTDAEKKIIDARMIAAADKRAYDGLPAPKAETVKQPEPVEKEIERDAVSALVCDQLALLVNALDSANSEQRETISTYAKKFAADSVVPSRARIWQALATAATV
jgi:hypothetical protein